MDERAEGYQGAQPSQTGCRASDKGILPMKLEEYLQLLDWTGRALARGKQGAIPDHLSAILDRLGINQFKWFDLVSRFDSLVSHVVGTAAQLTERAAQADRHWYHGRAAREEAFGGSRRGNFSFSDRYLLQSDRSVHHRRGFAQLGADLKLQIRPRAQI